MKFTELNEMRCETDTQRSKKYNTARMLENKMSRYRRLETVGRPAMSKELISLGFSWRAWAGRRQKRKEGRKGEERKGRERKKGGNKTDLDIIHLVII